MKDAQKDTILSHAGRDPRGNHGIVNPPVYHCSTVLFPTLAELEASDRTPFEGVHYGRMGTPTSYAFEEAVAELEGAFKSVSVGSGLNAIATALLAFTKAGDHVLITDSVYGPTRRFANDSLAAYGVEVEFYDPTIGEGIARLLKPNTSVVFLESPGSLTFEVQDVPAIAAAAKAVGATVIIDNTWATPLLFQPLRHGVDVSIHSATKYMVGHADAMLGVISCADEAHWLAVKKAATRTGACAGPDDLFLGLRGLRTLSVRLKQHEANALALAKWLSDRPEVTRVLHPAYPDCPGHALWKRDIGGSSGLFSVVMKPVPKVALAAMLDHMELFGMGYSWGGFESLILPVRPGAIRTATRWDDPGIVLRLHAGLEAADDLIRDLDAAFVRLNAAL
ncbi:cystathionine beta-lyase [Azospirillum rugosum]|uniref:Cystathionine beta-lyase n=1 Tax=Azospirillum rugosum TaxID=416170 RepID=A0ABS4SQ83_9PROT|nr:cystathionine beta-lyase [Azospirillum rugosum]MBP2294720.1 cystathionine beta-lyase [Azospirillum rugosum]MDQ0527991.1 cystathionine beta-lyase [Azospirillum rugosum]